MQLITLPGTGPEVLADPFTQCLASWQPAALVEFELVVYCFSTVQLLCLLHSHKTIVCLANQSKACMCRPIVEGL